MQYDMSPSEFDKLTDFEIELWVAAQNFEAEKIEFVKMVKQNG